MADSRYKTNLWAFCISLLKAVTLYESALFTIYLTIINAGKYQSVYFLLSGYVTTFTLSSQYILINILFGVGLLQSETNVLQVASE